MPRPRRRPDERRSEVWKNSELVEQIHEERNRLAARVRGLRRERGWTQEQLAEKAGIHAVHVVRIEGGAANVTFATLVALAVALQLPLRELFLPAAPSGDDTPSNSGARPEAQPGDES